ncbi:uncharacterized protein LOC115046638 isoform X2 [Echeneis naucrates]|uniref:uncharacterized protein LOC115046638 isoform X2 n=1 Tax=Echeneis naucrates TaxID=173247 RepID=UPI0011141678|nr:uncharacterized protein LOC115046638 isoform X2 [Echeneis naucrates]
MKIQHVLLFCCLSALCDGDSGLISTNTFVRAEGGSVVVQCPFSFSGRKKFLCKNECKAEDILIETRGSAAQRGRYSIKYKEGSFPMSSTYMHVRVTHLTKSDSGRYRCGLERRFLLDSYWEFELRVTDAPKILPEAVKQPEQQQQVEESTVKGKILPLVLCVIVLFAAVVLLLYTWKTTRESDGLTTRGMSDNWNMEVDLLYI